AHAARNSPFSVTLACVQVSPERYQTTGSFAPSACGGTNTEKTMSVADATERCLYTPCTPPWERLVDRDSSVAISAGSFRRSKDDDAADALARMHEIEGGVDLFQAHDMGDHRIDLDLAGHVHVDDLGHVGAALGAAKSGAAPVATGDELERPGAD